MNEPTKTTRLHDVHLFAVVRLKMPGIEAVSHRHAVRKAGRKLWGALYAAFTNANLQQVPAGVAEIEFGEEYAHVLVDEANDPHRERSTWHDGAGRSKGQIKTITVTIEDGFIASVAGIPPGLRVRVLDLDAEGMDADDLAQPPDGKQAIENVWAA